MRIKRAIFASVVAALASWTAPALASHTENFNRLPSQRRPRHRRAARCSRCRMERGSGSRVRKWVPRRKPRANPPREVPSSRRAESPVSVMAGLVPAIHAFLASTQP